MNDWAWVRGYLLGRAKRRKEAETLIGEYTRRNAPALQLGVMYLGLQEPAKALEHFERAVDEDASGMAKTIPEFYMRELDGEGRFQAIRKRLGN